MLLVNLVGGQLVNGEGMKDNGNIFLILKYDVFLF